MKKPLDIFLDIGCGRHLWWHTCAALREHGIQTRASAKSETLLRGGRCIGIDHNLASLQRAYNHLTRSQKRRTSFFQADATQLPFADESVDGVVLSNVLCSPQKQTVESDVGLYDAHLVISAKRKRRVITEAIRVLRPDGILIVVTHLTPAYAAAAMAFLRAHKKLTLVSEEGSLEERFGFHDHCLHHVLFVRRNPPDGHVVRRRALTGKARRLLRDLASEHVY